MKRILASISMLAALTVLVAAPAFAFKDVTPTEAYDMVTTGGNAYLIDVRTPAEWKWVGHPGMNKLDEGAALDGKVLNIPYKIETSGGMIVNPTFVAEVNALFGDLPQVKLVLMCRSGSRSVAAANALEAAGYVPNKLRNVLTGFEGGKDERGYRILNGWRNDGLPYAY